MSGFERFKCEERMPPIETPVLIKHRGRWRVGELRWDNPGWEDTYQAYQYWDDPWDDGQIWDWDDITEWCHLPPDDEDAELYGKNDKIESSESKGTTREWIALSANTDLGKPYEAFKAADEAIQQKLSAAFKSLTSSKKEES